jgi:RNA ligase
MRPPTIEPETTNDAARIMAELAADGFDDWSALGDIRGVHDGDLLLLTYTDRALYAARWNVWERTCRGLVVNTAAGYVVARPFDKFFNWGEGGRTTDAPIDCVTEKVDGSLIIAFWHGGWRTATRGSLSSPQAAWARRRIEAAADDLKGIPAVWTLLFEAVYPENRVVVNYGDREALYLLAMRHRGTGEYASRDFVRTIADSAGFLSPRVYDDIPPTVDGIRAALDGMNANDEGFVVTFTDGSRFKFKSAAYLALHKAVAGLSFKRAVEALRDGTTDEIAALVPEELRAEWDGWLADIRSTVLLTKLTLWGRMLAAPQSDRKTFVLWVQREAERWELPMLFALYDGKDVEPLIYKFILDGGQR